METNRTEEERSNEKNLKKMGGEVTTKNKDTRTASRVLIQSSDCFCQGDEPNREPKSTGAAQYGHVFCFPTITHLQSQKTQNKQQFAAKRKTQNARNSYTQKLKIVFYYFKMHTYTHSPSFSR